MSDLSTSSSASEQTPFFTPPSLPTGGGTVSAGGGMLSVGGADGAVGWTLPLPLPAGRDLSPQLTLSYSSAGGNSAFGAGWELSVPGIFRMSRFGVPRYGEDDRFAGPDGEEILRDKAGVRNEPALPFSTVSAAHIVTPWVARSGGRDQRIEHWRDQADTTSPGFWLHYHADGSITLYGWSASARLSDPAQPSSVAGWYAEETVGASGEHVVYTWSSEDQQGCSPEEKAAHSQVANVYPEAVYAMNITASQALLIPAGAFKPEDFISLMLFDYGQRGADISVVPPFEPLDDAAWTMRADPTSFWRWGFNVRTRRLCRDVLLWQRARFMAGEADLMPQLISRLHLTYQCSGVTSELVAAQQMAYEADGALAALPPVEFALSAPGGETAGWEPISALDGFSAPHWQMADLYGEGVPGLLYQDAGAWRYRAPLRATGGAADAICWDEPRILPLTPGLNAGMLTDLDGDGSPEWLTTLPGLHGSFTLAPDGDWGGFVPLVAMPSELLHPSAQLADLSGGGLQDVVMVGPKSVRLWASALRDGWQPAQEVEYDKSRSLPLTGGEARLTAFTDLAGSGQQHLTEITADGVTYWPSLGHGRFGEAVSVPGFAIEDFAASRVLLGDTDGSGTTDLLYIEADRIRVFISECGNRLTEVAPVPLPEGVTLERSCTLQLADVRGQGTAELMLTVPHMAPRTWLYRFNDRRPWLLSEVCTNTGSRTLFDYRSSAQGWLDEKAALQAQGQPAVSSLPFPVHMLCRVTAVDDISGLITGSDMRYLRGVWDGQEREFRGFTHLIQTDTLGESQGTAAELSPPSEVHSWFLSGLEAYDEQTPGAFTDAETDFPTRGLRITRLSEEGKEELFNPEPQARRWLLRALKGRPVRTEVYGRDDSAVANIPYSITRQRWQIRAYETGDVGRYAALVTPLETLTIVTERIAEDPVISQSILLEQDPCGNTLRSVDIRYHRRPPVEPSPYPASLPEGLEAAARDDQQDDVWLTLTRLEIININSGSEHLIGLVNRTRTDVLQLTADDVPDGGFTTEYLLSAQSPLADLRSATLGSHLSTQWCDTSGNLMDTPVRPPLVAWSETAMLDKASLVPLQEVLSADELDALLISGGYHAITLPEDQMPVWIGRHNYSRYAGESGFFRPIAVRESELTGETQLSWDPHFLAISATRDAAGLETTFEYDWRFITPQQVTDPNDNIHEVVKDALGRVTQSRFYGTEEGVMTGYCSGNAFNVPQTVEAALALEKGTVPVAMAHRVKADSWMPLQRDEQGKPGSTRIGELALRRWLAAHDLPMPDLSAEREPPHIISLQTDRYDGDTEQQVRISVTHSDGGGRLLQTAVLNPPGEALVRTPQGGLKADSDGKAVIEEAPVRWAVSGKTEYDDKGQPVRSWLPFYLNDWQPVYNDSARDGMYADTQLYDAMGRVYRVITAAGWERRTQFFPWFTVSEDENDTAEEVLMRRAARQKDIS